MYQGFLFVGQRFENIENAIFAVESDRAKVVFLLSGLDTVKIRIDD
jgi:hypothetical protein